MNKSEDVQKINEFITSGYEVNQTQIDTLNNLGWAIDWNKVGWLEIDGRSILRPTFTKNINKDLEIYIHEWEEGWLVSARQLYDLEDWKDDLGQFHGGIEPPGERTEIQDDGQEYVVDDTPDVMLVGGVSLELVENLVNLLKQSPGL